MASSIGDECETQGLAVDARCGLHTSLHAPFEPRGLKCWRPLPSAWPGLVARFLRLGRAVTQWRLLAHLEAPRGPPPRTSGFYVHSRRALSPCSAGSAGREPRTVRSADKAAALRGSRGELLL